MSYGNYYFFQGAKKKISFSSISYGRQHDNNSEDKEQQRGKLRTWRRNRESEKGLQKGMRKRGQEGKEEDDRV